MNHYAKMFMFLGDYVEANNYLSISISKKNDEFETIHLINKNDKCINDENKAYYNEDLGQLRQSMSILQSDVEHLTNHNQEIEQLKSSINSLKSTVKELRNENEKLKSDMKLFNDILPQIKQLLSQK